MNKIKSLQRGVCNSLRSSVILFDLPRVVEELTCNSLDSGATKVYISINMRACYVKVEDDGCGVTRDDLLILGERYATSKIHFLMDMETNNEGFGFRGEAIASLSDVSLVEIRTKARGMPNAYCKIIKGSKCLSFGIDDQREAVGTTVVVRDLFYNQPVRRNYMQTSPKRVLHSIKKSILRIALVHPQVLFKMTDIESEDELLYTVPSSSPLPLVSDAFGEEVSTSLEEVLFSDQVLTLSGYLSRLTLAFSTKAFQYIYINSRFVCKGPIHNLLNKLAASFQCSLPHCEIEPEVQTGKRRKTQATYPAFLLNFFCPLSSYDLHFEPSKTSVEFKDWSTVLAFFEQAMKQFWKQVSKKPLQGLSKSSKMKDAECDIKLHQNIPSNSSVTSPLDISLENTGICHKKGLPSEEMRRSSWLKPCQRNAGYLDHAGCSSQLSFNDSLATFGYPHAQLGYANSDKQYSAGVSSCLLEDNIISDQAHSFGDRYGMSDRERRNNIPDVYEDYGSLQKRTVDILLNFDSFDIIDNLENIESPESSFAENERSHSPGYKKGHSKSYTNQHSLDVGFDSLVKFSPFYDTTDNAEADNGFSVWHTQVQEKDGTCRPSTSVIGKSQENYDLEVSSNGRMDSFSCGEAPFSKKDKLDDALVSDFSVDDPKSGFPQLDWYLDEPHLSVKRLKSDARICDSRGCLPSFARTSSGYSGSIENVEILKSLQDSSDEVFPAKYTKTELDFQFDFSPMSNKQYPSLSNQNAFGKVSPFSLINNETGWSPSESSNMTNAEIYSKHAIRSSMQIQDEGCQSFWDELDLQNCRLSKVYKVGSKRSCSAPPFYEGKHRFSTIHDHLTMTARKETISPVNYLSQPPSSSQPCLKPNVNEISQTLSRKRTGEKVSNLQMNGAQNDGEVSDIEGSIAKLEYALAIPTKWRTGIPQSTDRDVSHTSKDNVLSISSGILHLSASSLIPDSINKECLQNARVLQQLDKKFIPVMAGEILVIVDQHAADERIRLEDLRQKVLSGEGNSVTYLDSEQELVLPELGYQLLQKYTDQIRNWGWICNIHNQCSDSFTKNVNILKRRKRNTTLVAVPCILGINLNEKDLIEFIEQLVETDGSSTIPPAVVRILNFKACRGAIMFGDSLLPSECSLILEELKATSLCFQCAHGRPTTVPLLNVASLHEQLRVLEVEKGGPGETWRGLSQHKPSIKRAQMRLESAKRFQGG